MTRIWPSQILLPSLTDFFWPRFGHSKSYYRISAALSGPDLAEASHTAESRGLFLVISWSYQIILPNLGGSFWSAFTRNKSYCRISEALSGLDLAVSNRIVEARGLFLIHAWLQQIVLPNLGDSFRPKLGYNKPYWRVSKALSGPPSAVQIGLPNLGDSFWPRLNRNNKLFCRILVALSGPYLVVTNRTAESW